MQVTESIWNDYHKKLHRFIQSRVTDTSIADDILQEVIIKVHSRIDTLKDGNKIQSWLYQIARNAIIDHFHSQKQTQELPAEIAYLEQNPIDKARQEIGTCLLPFIESLPENYRRTLTLSEMEGLTQKAVAAKQGLSLPGVKARVQRGRAMIKEMLLEGCRFELDRKGNSQAVKTFLKAKAPDRGYTAKLEITQTSKIESIDTKRLELLLSDKTTSDALEVVTQKMIEAEVAQNEK